MIRKAQPVGWSRLHKIGKVGRTRPSHFTVLKNLFSSLKLFGKMCKAGIAQGGLCEDCDDLRLIEQADVLVGPGGEKRKEIIVKMG